MGNKYYLQSADESLVADIKTPVASGSPLQALVKKTEANQYWTFESVPGQTDCFYILSADDSLSFDIKVPVASGSPLQALTKKSESNQWWKFQAVSGHPGYYHVVSAAGGLAVDIKDPVGSGAALQALTQKSEPNQWWTFVSAPGNAFDPKLAVPVTFIQLDPPEPPNSFSITGSGFYPGHPLTLSWIYTDSFGATSNTVTVNADPTGSFDSFNALPELAGDSSGTLGLEVSDPATGMHVSETAQWNGEAWGLI